MGSWHVAEHAFDHPGLARHLSEQECQPMHILVTLSIPLFMDESTVPVLLALDALALENSY